MNSTSAKRYHTTIQYSRTIMPAVRRCLLACLLVTGIADCELNRSFGIDYERDTFLKDGRPFR